MLTVSRGGIRWWYADDMTLVQKVQYLLFLVSFIWLAIGVDPQIAAYPGLVALLWLGLERAIAELNAKHGNNKKGES